MADSSLSLALKEAYAVAGADDVILHTLEVWHASFAVPIRVVKDNSALDAKLEASAPRNAGAVVTFVPFSFAMVPPDVTAEGLPSCTLELDNVGRDLGIALDAALLAGGPITVIYRAFLEEDALVGPETDPPMELTLMSATLTGNRFRAQAGFPDLLNRRFPDGEFTLDRFPGLAEI